MLVFKRGRYKYGFREIKILKERYKYGFREIKIDIVGPMES
jgi:hypothetical protein